jgi:polyisoprenoid-binding protein YceI
VARYRIVPGRSRVWVQARSSLHPIHSETDGLEGWLDLDVQDGDLDLDAPSSGHLELHVDRLRTGNAFEDAEMRRRVDTRRYPTISGDLAMMSPAGSAQRYLVEGDLTFRGVTRRYRDEMTVEVVDGSTLTLAGESTFDVRDHGLEPPRILMLKVEPEVKVRVAIVAEKED